MVDEQPVDLSVVIPVYGCHGCLKQLHERLTKALAELSVTYEIVFVDDRSPDGSWSTLQELAHEDERVLSVRLSRNFGQQAAITAGLAECSGKAALLMDCDLQDPPEYIPDLYAKHQEGFDVVMAEREKKTHSWFRRKASETYYAIMKRLNGSDYGARFGAFSLISRDVINSFLQFKDVNRHYLFIIEWLGYDMAVVPYRQAERTIGESSYNLRSLLVHAIKGLFFHSTLLLKWIIYLGLTLALAGVGYALLLLVCYFVYGAAEGWQVVVSVMIFLGGLQIATLGVVGFYVGQVFEQSKERPIYVVQKRVRRDAAIDREALSTTTQADE